MGDVVEFEYRYKSWIGICFNCHGNITLSVDSNKSSGDEAWAHLHEVSNARFIKHLSEVANESISWTGANKIAKAYFSKPTLTGSYEEQQAQAVAYYKWKFGSKIKMVKRNNLHAGGSRSLPHSQEEINEYGSFGTILMIKSDYIEVQIGDASSWSVAYTCLEPVK